MEGSWGGGDNPRRNNRFLTSIRFNEGAGGGCFFCCGDPAAKYQGAWGGGGGNVGGEATRGERGEGGGGGSANEKKKQEWDAEGSVRWVCLFFFVSSRVCSNVFVSFCAIRKKKVWCRVLGATCCRKKEEGEIGCVCVCCGDAVEKGTEASGICVCACACVCVCGCVLC